MLPESNSGQSLVKWPSTVSPEDIDLIKTFQREGKSLAASVATRIVKEAPNIECPEFYFRLAYMRPALTVLDAEQTVRGEEMVSPYLINPTNVRLQKIMRSVGNPEEEALSTIRDAETLLKLGEDARILREKGPLALIDACTNRHLELGNNNNDAWFINQNKAYVAGRNRFHMLYTVLEVI